MNPEDEFDVRQYLDVLRRKAWVIAAATLACALAAAALSFTQPKLYEATAKVLISAQQDISGTGNALSDPNQLQNQMQTQVQIAESPPVEQQANQALGEDARQVEDVRAAGVTNTRVMEITATSKSPAIAQRAADTYAATYLAAGQNAAVDRVAAIGEAVAAKQQQLRDQIATISAQLEKSPAPDAATRTRLTGQRTALNTQIDQLQRQYDNAQAGALVREAAAAPFANAELPIEPASPKPLRNIALAAILGLLLGTGIALLWDRMDDRVRSSAQLAQWFPGLPQLGAIPRVDDWKNSDEAKNFTLLNPQSQTAEAYRALRTSLEFLALDRELRVVEFTSATAGEGKSTTVANLATALAWAGKKVVIVGADLRRPRVHQFFGLPNEPGLTSILLKEKELVDALQTAPVNAAEGGTVDVLGTGPLPPNPSELLATTAVQDIFIKLREEADYVLIDAPPVLPVADALVLSKYSDGIVVVAGVGSLRKNEFARTVEILESSTKTPILGVLVNGSDEELSYSKKYGYYAVVGDAR